MSARLLQPSPPLSARLDSGRLAGEASSQLAAEQQLDEQQAGSCSGKSTSLAWQPGHGSRAQRLSSLGLAHSGIDGQQEREESGGCGGGSPQRQQLACSFAVLAQDNPHEAAGMLSLAGSAEGHPIRMPSACAAAGREGEQAGQSSAAKRQQQYDGAASIDNECELELAAGVEEEKEEQEDRAGSDLQMQEAATPSFRFGGARATSPPPAQAHAPFSFAASAYVSPSQPSPPQLAPLQARPRFAFASSSPPAGAAAAGATPASPPSTLTGAGAPLFSFAAMAAAASPSAAAALGLPLAQHDGSSSGVPPAAGAGLSASFPAALSSGSSEEDAFFSAAQSRATSAALTAYASAVSLRWEAGCRTGKRRVLQCRPSACPSSCQRVPARALAASMRHALPTLNVNCKLLR